MSISSLAAEADLTGEGGQRPGEERGLGAGLFGREIGWGKQNLGLAGVGLELEVIKFLK